MLVKNPDASKRRSASENENSRRSRGERRRRKASPRDDVDALLAGFGVYDWDFVIFGDGSGSSWNHQAGWASVSIERKSMEPVVWYGGVNRGTNNFAELMAYLQPLNWIASRESARRKKHKTRRAVWRIHVVTDSQYCRDAGTAGDPSCHAALWGAVDGLTRQGFLVYWHWLRREEAAQNHYADQLSKLARRFMARYNLQEALEQRGLDLPA